MRLLRTMQIAIAGPLLCVTLAAAPALAHESAQGAPPPLTPPPGYAPAPYEDMAPEVRNAWLADCQARMGRHRSREAEDYCVRYLDDYYAAYRQPQPYGYQGPAYGFPGYAAGCCQPMMMVPIMQVPGGKPDCKETIEYEYVEVPERAPPRRPVRDKRVKIAPDKRIQVR